MSLLDSKGTGGTSSSPPSRSKCNRNSRESLRMATRQDFRVLPSLPCPTFFSKSVYFAVFELEEAYFLAIIG